MSQTLSGILAELFDRHSDQLRKVLANQQTILCNQETMKADLLSIKVFLGVPDIRVGATQEDIDSLGQKLKDEAAAVIAFDEAITLEPPA